MKKKRKISPIHLSLKDNKKKSSLPIWLTLLTMFLAGFIYGFTSIRCECSSKIGCQNCSYLEAAILSAVFFVLISLIPVLIGFYIIRYKERRM